MFVTLIFKQKKPAVSKSASDLRMSLKAGDLPFVAGKVGIYVNFFYLYW